MSLQEKPGFPPKKKANLLPSNTQPGLLEGWILERKQENPLMETVSRPPRFPPNREAKRPVSMSFLLGESGAKLRAPPPAPPNKRPSIAGAGVGGGGRGVLSSPSSGTRGALLWRSLPDGAPQTSVPGTGRGAPGRRVALHPRPPHPRRRHPHCRRRAPWGSRSPRFYEPLAKRSGAGRSGFTKSKIQGLGVFSGQVFKSWLAGQRSEPLALGGEGSLRLKCVTTQGTDQVAAGSIGPLAACIAKNLWK